MLSKSVTFRSLFVLAVSALASGSAHAQTIADVKTALQNASSNITISLTSNPVVTQFIVRTPGVSNTLLLQDATGALEAFAVSISLYTPTIGDTISLTGTFTSFHGLLEFEPTYTAIAKTGTASLPAPSVFTIAGMTDGSPIGLAQQSMLGTLSNVSFTATGTFVTNTSYTVSDAHGSAIVFVGTGSPLIGQAIPVGPVNVYGYMGQFATTTAFGSGAFSTSGYELDPLSITSAITASVAPEPGTLMEVVAGVGFLGLAAIRRRKRG